MKNIGKELMDFIDKTPNCYLCVKNISDMLDKEGYERLYEDEKWDSSNLLNGHNYYVIRNDASIISFKIPEEVLGDIGFNIVSTHTDSPSFVIKVNPEMIEDDYAKLNVRGYGGMINYSWLDRPLSLAGRVVLQEEEGVYRTEVINLDYDMMVIPSQALHINREVNKANDLNHQIDMLPIVSLGEFNLKETIKGVLDQHIKYSYKDICDFDLYLYNRDKAKCVGENSEFILSPRLDDLACVLPAIKSFINSDNSNLIPIFAAFNNEEIGSLSMEGADSTFLFDVLSRVADVVGINIYSSLANSFVVSADNAHAIHPNAKAKSDPTNKVHMGKGIVIKHHINYTTDAISSSVFKGICDSEGILHQDFECRSDMRCGSTLGKISQRHVAVNSIDIGIGQLAMHSANELICLDDVEYMYKALCSFYNTPFRKEKGMVKILSNNKEKK